MTWEHGHLTLLRLGFPLRCFGSRADGELEPGLTVTGDGTTTVYDLNDPVCAGGGITVTSASVNTAPANGTRKTRSAPGRRTATCNRPRSALGGHRGHDRLPPDQAVADPLAALSR